MQIAVLGIDLGKNSCSVVGLDGTGRVVLRRRMQRDSVIEVCLRPGAMRGGDGSLLRRAPSRPLLATRDTRCG